MLYISSLVKVTSSSSYARFTVMLNGAPDTNQLSRLVCNVCCSCQDATAQVVTVLYFYSTHFFFYASSYGRIKGFRSGEFRGWIFVPLEPIYVAQKRNSINYTLDVKSEEGLS
jgi:hypothetical protein